MRGSSGGESDEEREVSDLGEFLQRKRQRRLDAEDEDEVAGGQGVPALQSEQDGGDDEAGSAKA